MSVTGSLRRFRFVNSALISVCVGVILAIGVIATIEPQISTLLLLNFFDAKLWRHLGTAIQGIATFGGVCLVSSYVTAGFAERKHYRLSAGLAGGVLAFALYLLMTFLIMLSAVS